MVLLEEDPHKLLASVQENFGIDGDTAQITRISEQFHLLRQVREKQNDEQQHLLRLLTRKLDVSRQSYEESVAEHEQAGHNQTITALDRKKFALAKGVNDLESTAHSLEGQLAKLREELEMLDGDEPLDRAVEGDEAGTTYVHLFDEQTGEMLKLICYRLKLRVFRSLEIELQEDGAGGFNKAVVRNMAKGGFRVVNIEGKFTQYFYSNYFWDLL